MEKHPPLPPLRHRHHARCSFAKLENIEEERPCLALSLRPPETPTEAMEFLARSWRVSAVEISKALTSADDNSSAPSVTEASPVPELKIPVVSEAFGISPPISPRDHIDLKLLRNSARVKTMGGWLKDQREKKRAEARTRKAQAYAATSVAGVAAAVAAVVASTVFSGPDGAKVNCGDNKITAAIASAAALVASHCVEMAQTMGASHDQIIKAIRSAVGAQTGGDVMALTAGAATALRGAATLRARLYKEIQGATATGEDKESHRCLSDLTFVARGGELLKRTRKGLLHWKHVSVFINSNGQVVVKTKSTHMAGTFVKKKKSIVIDVSSNVPAWPGRELEYDELAKFALGHHREATEPGCIRAVLAEVVLTFLFVFAGVGAAMTAVKMGAGDSITGLTAVAVAVMISAGLHVSGGHLNPAVTLGLAVGGNISVVRLLLYFVAQLLGSTSPASSRHAGTHGNGFRPRSDHGSYPHLLSHLLFFVYGTIVDPKKIVSEGLGPLLVGLVVGANILAGGPFSGASMNLARSFGPALASGNWTDHWVYWVGPLIGGALAGIVYDGVFIIKVMLLFPGRIRVSAEAVWA